MKNISSKSLSNDENQLLQKGLNFNTGHKKRDVLDTIAALDDEIDKNSNIPNNDKPALKLRIWNFISMT